MDKVEKYLFVTMLLVGLLAIAVSIWRFFNPIPEFPNRHWQMGIAALIIGSACVATSVAIFKTDKHFRDKKKAYQRGQKEGND